MTLVRSSSSSDDWSDGSNFPCVVYVLFYLLQQLVQLEIGAWEISNYFALKVGEGKYAFQINMLYRQSAQTRSADNVRQGWLREQAVISVTSNDDNINTSVSVRNNLPYSIWKVAFVSRWVWGNSLTHWQGDNEADVACEDRCHQNWKRKQRKGGSKGALV